MEVYCDTCLYFGEAPMGEDGGGICPVCSEHIYDSAAPEDFEEFVIE